MIYLAKGHVRVNSIIFNVGREYRATKLTFDDEKMKREQTSWKSTINEKKNAIIDTTIDSGKYVWDTTLNLPKASSELLKASFDVVVSLSKINIYERSQNAAKDLQLTIQHIAAHLSSLNSAIKEISDQTERQVGYHQIQVVFGDYLRLIPGLISVEHLYKVFTYQTINMALKIILKTGREQVAKDLSKIMIEKALEPHNMAFEILEYLLKYNMVVSEESDVGRNLKMYYGWIKTVSKLIKKK